MNKYILRTSLVLDRHPGSYCRDMGLPHSCDQSANGNEDAGVRGYTACSLWSSCYCERVKTIHARYEDGCSARSRAAHTREDAEHWRADWHSRVHSQQKRIVHLDTPARLGTSAASSCCVPCNATPTRLFPLPWRLSEAILSGRLESCASHSLLVWFSCRRRCWGLSGILAVVGMSKSQIVDNKCLRE
jgi:hypothetical protein